VAYGEASHQDAFDELLGGQGRQLPVEATDMDAVDAAFGEQLEFVAQAGQTRGRLIRREQFARMRLEGEHRRRQARVRAPWPSIRQAAHDGRDARHRNCRWSAPWTSWPAREHREKPAWD
jgi:hypothetical protein